MGEFGNKFRKEREKKALSLDDVSHVTKIGSRMLQAIEEENFDRLPGGIFNKGFIRTYAKHLGLNDDEAIAAYLACLRQTQIDAITQIDTQKVRDPERRPGQARAAAPQKPSSMKSGKPAASKSRKNGTHQSAQSPAPAQLEELPELQLPRAEDVRPRRRDFGSNSGPEIPWRLIAVAAVVLILATVLWTRRSHRAHASAFTSFRPSPAQSAPAAAPASGNPSPTSPSTSPAASSAQRTTSTPQPLLQSASASSAHSPALAPASAPSPANNIDHVNNNNDHANDNAAGRNPLSVPPSQKSNLAPSEKPPGSLTLVIRATETSWISVLADGQPVSHETLIAPARTSVHADREIIVKVGNAAGVAFFWNGQDVPPDGAEAEVKTYVFDSTGMRSASATPPPAQ